MYLSVFQCETKEHLKNLRPQKEQLQKLPNQRLHDGTSVNGYPSCVRNREGNEFMSSIGTYRQVSSNHLIVLPPSTGTTWKGNTILTMWFFSLATCGRMWQSWGSRQMLREYRPSPVVLVNSVNQDRQKEVQEEQATWDNIGNCNTTPKCPPEVPVFSTSADIPSCWEGGSLGPHEDITVEHLSPALQWVDPHLWAKVPGVHV